MKTTTALLLLAMASLGAARTRGLAAATAAAPSAELSTVDKVQAALAHAGGRDVRRRLDDHDGHDHGDEEHEEEEEHHDEHDEHDEEAHDDHDGHDHGEEEDEHAGHDHGGAHEWGGIFELEHGETYSWIAQKVDGDYADPSMKIVAVETSAGDAAALEAAETAADALLEGECADLHFGESFAPGACYTLVFEEAMATSIYALEVPEDRRRRLEDHAGHDHGGGDFGYFAIFADHFPTEFERDAHYLKDGHGDDVEPMVETDGGGGGESEWSAKNKWRNSMVATLLVLLCTFVGILGRLPFKNIASLRTDTVIAYASALAVGALLGCAAFLMLVEGSHLVGARWAEEDQMTWRFGTCLLAGYGVGMLINLAFPHGASARPRSAVAEEIKGGDAAGALVEEGERLGGNGAETGCASVVDRAFCFNIFMGDFLHNFVDGIFIAGAFMDCAPRRGWVVTAATVYHELVQEFADFFLLIGPGGLSVVQASGVNFLSGVSVVAGAAIYVASEPGPGTQGLMLAFSAGIYLYVACTEAATHVIEGAAKYSAKDRIILFACFMVGAVGIGLVLLDHEHCVPKGAGEGSDPHAGHNH